MDAERFRAIVSAYGADARRWPEAEREAARAFAARPEAAALLAEAAGLDALLDSATVESADAGAMLARLRAAPAPAPTQAWRLAAALAACALFGVAAGYGGVRQAMQADIADMVLADLIDGSGG